MGLPVTISTGSNTTSTQAVALCPGDPKLRTKNEFPHLGHLHQANDPKACAPILHPLIPHLWWIDSSSHISMPRSENRRRRPHTASLSVPIAPLKTKVGIPSPKFAKSCAMCLALNCRSNPPWHDGSHSKDYKQLLFVLIYAH